MYSSLYSQGATEYASGDYKAAAETLKKATEADETQYDAWYYLAFAYYNLNDTKNADKTFAETIVRFPQYEEVLSQYITDSSVLTAAKSGKSGDSKKDEDTADDATADDATDGTADGTAGNTDTSSDASAQDAAGNTDGTSQDEIAIENGYYDEYGNWISY